MKILVTGANGLLGQHLVKQLLDKGYTVIATSLGRSRLSFPQNEQYTYHELDVTDGPVVNRLLNKLRPEVLIHAAAMTQVDQCEEEKITCWNINVTATRFLVDACKEIGARFIFVSTDFVFDGLHGPYSEASEPNPVNYYGSSKWGAEKAVEESGLQWAIVRTVLVTGNPLSGTRHNIITWVKEKLEKGEKIRVVDDQYRTPTFVEDLAAGIILVLEKNAQGLFHISGKDSLTPYAIAVETARLLKLDERLIEKADSASLGQPAVRPARTGFIIGKAEKELGYKPHSFRESLEKMFASR
ncbi:MAG TPA: NAD(P)-dependent oxidoreductase [Chitinophagaceae bacterium]|nr:NAD(P)-dependent oxidoreductase [Chitinophagaceae bacterium]